MGADTTTLSGLLKEFYRDVIVKQISDATTALDLFTKGDADGMEVGGKYVTYPMHFGRNTGAGSIGEDKTLPVAGNQQTADVQIPYKSTYGRMRLTGQIMEASKMPKGAFKKALSMEMDNLVMDVSRQRNRQLLGFGVGIMARVNGSNASGTTVNLKDAGGVAYNTAGGTPIGAGRFLQVGDYIVFVRNATPTSAADSDIVGSTVIVKVSTIATDLNSITVSATTGATLNDNDMVVLSPGQLVTESSVNREVMGLQGIVDDSTYITTLHAISRSTYPQWKGTVLSATGAFNLKTLQRAENLAQERGGAAKKYVLISHQSVKQEYVTLLQTIKRFVNDGTKSPDLGSDLSEVKWNNHEWRVDRMCAYGTIFGVDPTYNLHYENSPGDFVDTDGTILLRVADKDAYEGRWRIIDNFTNDKPCTNFRLDGITATVDVTSVV